MDEGKSYGARDITSSIGSARGFTLMNRRKRCALRCFFHGDKEHNDYRCARAGIAQLIGKSGFEVSMQSGRGKDGLDKSQKGVQKAVNREFSPKIKLHCCCPT